VHSCNGKKREYLIVVPSQQHSLEGEDILKGKKREHLFVVPSQQQECRCRAVW
jgi:hypothetical protein